jgi:putative transposase
VTIPRRLLPGSFYLLTRRCTQRQFLLRPSRLTNQIVGYCLAAAAEHSGVLLHAVCVMSNHWHAVVSDPEARLPEFLERAHRLIAKCQNSALGRWENLWSSEKTSVVYLAAEQDVLDKMAYVIANPTAAGLVRSPEEWPGVITRRLGERITFEMPDHFFDEANTETDCDDVVLESGRPAIFAQLSDEELDRRLFDAVAERVRVARAAMRAAGKSFLGVQAVLRQPFTARPLTREVRRKLNPRVAAANPSIRVAALRALQQFVAQYRNAWCAWREGKRDVVFPLGTYALRVHTRARCEELCTS